MTAVIFVAVITLACAPLAIEQLGYIKSAAEELTGNAFLSDEPAIFPGEKETTVSCPSAAAVSFTNHVQSSSDEFRWSGRVASGRTIEIKGVNGDVKAEPSSSDEVEVVAVKKGTRSDARAVEVRVVEHAGGVTICAVYPSPDAGRPNECKPDEGGHNNVSNNDVRVDFSVRVPQGVRFDGRTVNGDVATGALGSDVEAKTVNGSIKISASGVARAKTVNGSITASFSNPNWTGPLEFKTVNGEINLDLPSNTNANVHAQTLNGEISTDFPMTVQGKVNRREMNGTIGGGGRELTLKTVNGSIKLRRAS
jgi:hypothetical protein